MTSGTPKPVAACLLALTTLSSAACRHETAAPASRNRGAPTAKASSSASAGTKGALVPGLTFETSEGLLATLPKDFENCFSKLADRDTFDIRSLVSGSTRRVAYRVCRKGKQAVVSGEQQATPYDEVRGPYFVGDDVVYFGRDGKKWFQFVNDGKGSAADRPPALTCRGETDPFYVDCRLAMLGLGPERWANFTTHEARQRVVTFSLARVPGKPSELKVVEGEPFDEIGSAAQMPDGTLVYSARDHQKWVVMVGAKRGPEFDQIGLRDEGSWVVLEPCISANHCFEPGSRDVVSGTFAIGVDQSGVAFPARRGKDWFIADLERTGPRFDSVSAPLYSPKQRAVVYSAKSGKDAFVMVGTERRGPFTRVEQLRVTDSGDVAYVEVQGKEWSVVVGSERRGPYAEVRDLRSSSAGTISYAYLDSKKWRMVRNGESDPPFDDLSPAVVRGTTVAYFGVTRTKAGKSSSSLVIDGHVLEGEPTRAIELDGQGAAAFVVRIDGKLRVDRVRKEVATPGSPLDFDDIRRLVIGRTDQIAYAARSGKGWMAVLGSDGKQRGPVMDQVVPIGFTATGELVYLGLTGSELWRKILRP